jgi:sugar diacid utilization regulator
VLDRLHAHFGPKVLLVRVDGALWAWLGGQNRPTEKDIERGSIGRMRSSLGIGEPGLGLEGWRLTHDQARAALAVALRKSRGRARYADDRLLAAALDSDTLARSLRHKYLAPLCSQRDGGATLRRTLRTYIDLDCNATSAGEVLKVGRRAVKSRIRTAERLIGSSLSECLAEFDVALHLAELDTADN